MIKGYCLTALIRNTQFTVLYMYRGPHTCSGLFIYLSELSNILKFTKCVHMLVKWPCFLVTHYRIILRFAPTTIQFIYFNDAAFQYAQDKHNHNSLTCCHDEQGFKKSLLNVVKLQWVDSPRESKHMIVQCVVQSARHRRIAVEVVREFTICWVEPVVGSHEHAKLWRGVSHQEQLIILGQWSKTFTTNKLYNQLICKLIKQMF